MHPKTIHGLRVPLFDRLVNSAPEVHKELTPLRVQGREALFSSIARDLQRLLNTRRASDAPLDVANATVLDYGIPDFSQFSASSVTDRRYLAETLRVAISAFEPRLQEIFIHIESSDSSPHQIVGSISCKAALGNLLEPMTFPILLHGSEHTIEVIAPQDQPAAGSLSGPAASEPSYG
ncbi:MAG: type VI secretion system baseplate subunit TssE [Edaphobacter sp.]